MQHSFGRTAVGVAGAGLILVGVLLAWQALSGKREFELQTASPSVRRGVETLAKVGRTARAVIIAAAGVFVIKLRSPSIQQGEGPRQHAQVLRGTHPSAPGCSC